MTTDEAKKILGVQRDAQLARKLGLTRGAVHQWRGVVPALREYQIQAVATREQSAPQNL